MPAAGEPGKEFVDLPAGKKVYFEVKFGTLQPEIAESFYARLVGKKLRGPTQPPR